MNSTIRVNCQMNVHYIWLDKYDEIVELWYMVRVWSSGAAIVRNGLVKGFYKRAWLSLGGKLSQKSWCMALWSFPLYDQIYVIQ